MNDPLFQWFLQQVLPELNQESARSDPVTPSDLPYVRLEQVRLELHRVIVGQERMLDRLLACVLAEGHCLLEGVPGLGKTLTLSTLARVIGGTFSRIQFTADLIPADIVGTRIYRPSTESFDFEPGPGPCERRPGRRDQPRAGQGPVGPARGHAGATGHRRWPDDARAPAVRRRCNPESDRV